MENKCIGCKECGSSKKKVSFASALLYFVPIIFFVIGILIGNQFNEGMAIIAAFLFLATSLFVLFITDKYFGKRRQ